MYVETNRVEKMVSFLDVGLVSPFGRRRTVTEAGFVSIIEDILPLTTPGIVDREQEQRKRERERERRRRRRKREKKSNLATFRLEPIPSTSPSPSFHLDLLRKNSYPSISSISFLVARLIFFFSSRDGEKGVLSSRF